MDAVAWPREGETHPSTSPPFYLFLVSYKKQNSWVGVFVKGQIEPHTMRVFAVVDSAQLNQVMDGRQGLRRAAPVTG